MHPNRLIRLNSSEQNLSVFIQGFTLIELLVVIAILAVLAVVVVLTLNPAGLLQESRDANRLQDMATLNSAISYSLADNATESLGSVNTVYVSMADPTATSTAGDQCQGLGLPSLPSLYAYHCAASSTWRKTDGTGWVPVSLANNSFGSSLSQLPVDPVNATSSKLWYTYETDANGKFEVTAQFESSKYRLGGSSDQISSDGGSLASVYEKGSKLGLEPLDYGDTSLVGYWNFDEGTGTVAYDSSGNNASGTLVNSPLWVAGRIGSSALNFISTSNQSVNFGSNIENGGSAMTISAWIKTTQASSGQILTKWSNSGPDQCFVFQVSSGNMNFIFNATNGTDDTLSGAITINDGNWHYVVATYDKNVATNNQKIYVDGALDSQRTGDPGFTSCASNLYVGRYTNDTGDYTGAVDDARIYNRALSAGEIRAIYSGGK